MGGAYRESTTYLRPRVRLCVLRMVLFPRETKTCKGREVKEWTKETVERWVGGFKAHPQVVLPKPLQRVAFADVNRDLGIRGPRVAVVLRLENHMLVAVVVLHCCESVIALLTSLHQLFFGNA